MKYRKICFLASIIFISLLFYSCSDWSRDKENPVEVSTTDTGETVPEGVILISGFPKNISALFFQTGGVYLAGTTEGLFYKSSDYGKKWIKSGEMADKAKINFIMAESRDAGKSSFIAGTNKGGYFSSDAGSSWKEALPAKNESGKYRTLTYGVVNSSIYTFYGDDGVNNTFRYSFLTYTWTNTKNDVHIPGGLLAGNIFDYSASYTLRGYNNESKSAIIGSYNNIWEAFDDNLNISVTITLRTTSGSYRYLLGTKNGFKISTDYGTTWNKTSLEGHKINCAVCYGSGSMLFAGSGDGVYQSTDYGITWLKLITRDDIGSVNYMFINNNTVYFVDKNGDTYYFIIPIDLGTSVYAPIPFQPLNNSELSSQPTLQWARSDEGSKVAYRLQISSDSLFSAIIKDTVTSNIWYKTPFAKSGNKCFWRLRSQNIFFESKWSVVYNFKY